MKLNGLTPPVVVKLIAPLFKPQDAFVTLVDKLGFGFTELPTNAEVTTPPGQLADVIVTL